MTRTHLALLLAFSLLACSADPIEPGAPDAAGLEDAGGSQQDGGDDLDAGAVVDAGVDAGTDAGPGSSMGSGGLPCEQTGTVSASGVSYSYCVAQVGSTQLKIIEPAADGSGAPLRLAIYLHGDGARAHTNDTALRLQAPWTHAHRTLYVSVRAPNACAWWLRPEYTACDGTVLPGDIDSDGENADALEQAIQALRGGWDLTDGPILFGGSSGGSLFLTASFLPMYGDRFPGAYALGCGGEEPWSGDLGWDSSNPELLGPTKLYFTYGDQDEILAEILRGVAFYRDLEFPLDEKVLPGVTHCAFDHIGRAVEVWAEYLGE